MGLEYLIKIVVSKFLLGIFLFASLALRGQDTLSIYFEFGQSKIPINEQEKLGQISSQFDLSELDSIEFIGMADSVGNFEDNLKLSGKRAKNVSKYCKRFLPKLTSVKVKALGEKSSQNTRLNRRVDIIMFFPILPAIEGEEEVKDDRFCYYVDNRLLHRSHFRTIKNRRKKYVHIEIEMDEDFDKRAHYYGSYSSKNGFSKTRLRWKTKKTGMFWWEKRRLIATIPEKSFDRYKVFQALKPACDTCSCDSCHQDFETYPKIRGVSYCLQVDRFLMANMQYKRILFNNSFVKVRVPREYVNLDKEYLVGCDYTNLLRWYSRKGWRRKKYYYAKLPIRSNGYMCNITRQMECCKEDPEGSDCDISIINCDTEHFSRGQGITYKLFGEVGSSFQNEELLPYIGLGFGLDRHYDFRRRYNNLSGVLGVDYRFNLYGSIRYQRFFDRISPRKVKLETGWNGPQIQKPKLYKWYARPYIGTELKTILGNDESRLLEQNFHFGLALDHFHHRVRIPRYYLQLGLGYDYLNNYSNTVYPIAQIGVNIRIAKFVKDSKS